MAGWYGARLIVLVIGVLLALSGLAIVAGGPPHGVVRDLGGPDRARPDRRRRSSSGRAIARTRRSAARRRTGPVAANRPDEPIDPRFRPTEERFEDPTTRRRMRVWLDPTSGERRYVAED